MDSTLQRWPRLTKGEIVRSMLVFQTLSVMYQHSTRALDEQEAHFVKRMGRLLNHESVKSVMAHTSQNITVQESRVMESLIFADAVSESRSPGRQARCDDPGP